MVSGNKAALKITAAVGMIVGLMGMVVGWSLLFTTGSNGLALGGEMGGVVLCLAGYFLWQKANRPMQPPSAEGRHRD